MRHPKRKKDMCFAVYVSRETYLVRDKEIERERGERLI